MAMFIKAKRASGPLDERVKTRLLSSHSSSSGSNHDADPCSLCGLIHAFLELDESDHSSSGQLLSCSRINSDDDDDDDDSFYGSAIETLQDLLHDSASLPGLRSAVMEAAESLTAGLQGSGGSTYRRAVMSKLREKGYDAGLCKSKWKSGSGSLNAGSYEYIDITLISDQDSSTVTRYILDLDFAAQFEIARATAEYENLVAMLPTVMIARAEEVKQVVRTMAEAAKRSLKSTELSVPPWRNRRYMIAKWFGPYRRRTVNGTITSLPIAAGNKLLGDVKCRAVGFEAGPWGVVAPAMR